MSQVDCILGIAGLAIESVKSGKSIEVWAKPSFRPSCIHCQHPHVHIKATRYRHLKHSRMGNRLVVLHLAMPKYRCLACQRYFQPRLPGILPRRRTTENFRLEVFEAHSGGVSQKALSQTHRIGCATIERWYQSFIQQRASELSGRACPRVLGIDEHFFSRRRGYATTFVDLANHKVFDVVLGRSQASLHSYLSQLPERHKVQIVVMDLSETYRSIAQKYFPNAKIVADRFHVIRMINQHFLACWNKQDPTGRKNRGLISLMRRHAWNLKPEQVPKLNIYLQAFPALKALYDAKQKLVSLLLLKTLNAKKAKKMLPQFLQLIEQFKNSPAQTIAHTLLAWLDPIVRMWRFPQSNGITEGFHNKMEMITRRAFGFRNFNNYRLRVLALCGWSGIINRV
jgi:transposase